MGAKKLAFYEKPQLVHQFDQLDNDGDGAITWKDVEVHVRRINPIFFDEKEPAAIQELFEGWIKEASINQSTSLDLIGYAKAVVKLRKDSKATGYNEITRTPFWDLRSVVLCYPTVKPKGQILKRGHMIAFERANAWRSRHFQAVSVEEAKTLTQENEKANKGVPLAPVDPKFMLGYYVNDPQFPQDETGKPVDVTRKGTINLLDVNVVDISPKTAVSDTLFGSLKSGSSLEKEDLENMIVFKVTVSSGRRYTLAAPEADAIEWICYFTWFSNAWRSADKWIDQFGSRKLDKITIRDWALAGTVVAKISLGAAFKDTTEAAIKKAAASKNWRKVKNLKEKLAKTFAEKYEINDKDRNFVALVGLDMSSLEDAQNTVIKTIKTMVMNKAYFQQIDKSFCFGAFQWSATGIIAIMNAYAYGSAFKNQVRQNTYSVKWDSKGEARECAVCHVVFKTLTLRKTMSKCHCRCCGRVVCHMCATKEVYLEVTGKFERICESCILVGHPPADRLILSEDDIKEKVMKRRESGTQLTGLLARYDDSAKKVADISDETETVVDVEKREKAAIQNVAIKKEQQRQDELRASGIDIEMMEEGKGGCCVIS